MSLPDGEPEDVGAYARENKQMLLRVLRHGSSRQTRAYAWAILDMGLSDPEIDELEAELKEIKEGVA